MDIKAKRARLRELIEKARPILDGAAAENRELTKSEAADVKSAMDEARELGAEIRAAEQGTEMRKTLAELGDAIAAPSSRKSEMHPRVKASGGSGWADSVLKAVSGADGFKGILASGTVAVDVPLEPEPVHQDVPVLAVRQLMPNVQNTTGRFAYLRQNTRTNNAAVVAPGAKKPTSTYQLERIDDRVRTIAHLSEPIAKQDLDDVPLLRPFIDQEMRLGLDLALENEIINGSGSGEHLTGLANVSGSQSQAYTTDVLTTARKAVTKLERYGYIGRAGWLMSPEDWEAFELTQDNEARFYYGGPVAAVNTASRRLWGVPVVVSEAATDGTAYLADFSQMKLQVRQDGVLDWSENVYDPNALGTGSGASDFERNMLRFRFEGRFGLEILRPSAIVEVDLTA
ncbi:phage major capsid protein [Streptomyces cucumeris]|uniref:phage major capsid protein n=1 Tax=Streptomyces cucumeris TaxID=2962890 RepID=UPI0020C9309D|nr:phage major capsid protein [Streptomyces sp. NEAU-Y11]MCP9209963.1 phage major capsid protein [Streptomyces sp. NEAU-Y11]